MVSVTKHNTPALRFGGFDDEWDTSELNDLVEVGNGRDYKHLNEGRIPVYGTGGYMLSVDQALSYNKDAIGIGRKGTIDKPFLLRAPFWTVDTLFFVMARSSIDLPFLFSVFQRVDWKSKNTATGVPSLTSQAIEQTTVTIAPSLKEQQAIGELFANLDAFIEQHRAKHANLQQTKTALMQRMFPQDGSNEPELRLGEFSGVWEATEVKHITTRAVGGGTPSRAVPDYWNGSTPWIQSSDVKEHTVFGCTPKHFISSRGLASSATSLVKGGSLAIVTRVGVGKVAVMTEDYCSSQDFLNLSGLQGDLTFLGVLLQSELEEMSSRTQGTSIKGVTKENVMSLSIQVPPTLEEQRAIGEVFSNLDALIADEHRYITQLTQAKTALLQRMFV